jgi:GT2 family glycosyltransferase
VVDNNSFDGTQDWLKYSGEVNTYICLSENKGLAGAMIEGFHLVDSEYFVFTQDDVWPPDLQPCWLERMLGLFKRNENKFVGISMVINKQPL